LKSQKKKSKNKSKSIIKRNFKSKLSVLTKKSRKNSKDKN